MSYGTIPVIKGVQTLARNDGLFHDGLSVAETGEGKVRRTVLTFRDAVLAYVGDGSHSARIAQSVYTFPEGLIDFKGAVVDLTLAADNSAVGATQAGFVGLGSVAAAANADTLATTTQDFAASAATTAVAGVAPAKAVATALALFDGTSAAKQAFLNILATAVGTAVAAAPTNAIVNGTIAIDWEIAGDK